MLSPVVAWDVSLFPVKDLFCGTLQKYDSLSNPTEFWAGHKSALQSYAVSKWKG